MIELAGENAGRWAAVLCKRGDPARSSRTNVNFATKMLEDLPRARAADGVACRHRGFSRRLVAVRTRNGRPPPLGSGERSPEKRNVEGGAGGTRTAGWPYPRRVLGTRSGMFTMLQPCPEAAPLRTATCRAPLGRALRPRRGPLIGSDRPRPGPGCTRNHEGATYNPSSPPAVLHPAQTVRGSARDHPVRSGLFDTAGSSARCAKGRPRGGNWP